MIDFESVKYTVKEIQRDRNRPYQMANEELVEEEFPELKKNSRNYRWYLVFISG